MIRRILLLLSLLTLGFNAQVAPSGHVRVGVESAALAVELHPDPGCDNAGMAMADTGASVTGSKCVFTNVKAMKGLMWTAATKKGHSYIVNLTVSGYTQGIGRFLIGADMMTTPTYAPLPAVNLNGLTGITDSLAMVNGNGVVPQAIPGSMGADPMGAFRIACGTGPRGTFDPVVDPGLDGRSHLHQFVGGTFATTTSNYTSLRQHGGSTCGTGGRHSVNNSLYWQPAMLDGAGHVIVPWMHIIYYKRQPESSSFCNPASADYVAGTGGVGGCISLPNGIKFIAGYNMATGTGGPLDDPSGGPAIIKYGCNQSDSTSPVVYSNHLSDLFGGACPIGYIVNVQVTSPDCWDGANMDSATHRTHIINPSVNSFDHLGGSFFACPADHPYKVPNLQWSEFWIADANLLAGKWHLASDEMVVGAMVSVNRGKTEHLDYDEAWDTVAKAAWYTNCINGHLSGSNGNLCQGQGIKGDPGKFAQPSSNHYESLTNYGYGPDITANGTYTFELKAPKSGIISMVGIEDASGNGFSASVDSISVVEKTTGRKGPATVTVHGAGMASNDNFAPVANDNLPGVLPLHFNLASMALR